MNEKLKVYEHPYYCETSGNVEYFETFEDFLNEMKDADKDYNLLFRFDLEQEEGEINLKLHYVQQRKGRLFTCMINNFNMKDEHELIKYLRPNYDYIQKLWTPLTNCEGGLV